MWPNLLVDNSAGERELKLRKLGHHPLCGSQQCKDNHFWWPTPTPSETLSRYRGNDSWPVFGGAVMGGENLHFVWHIFQDISRLALSIVTFQKVRATLGKIPLNPPFSKGEPVGMPCLIEKLLSILWKEVRGSHKVRGESNYPVYCELTRIGRENAPFMGNIKES